MISSTTTPTKRNLVFNGQAACLTWVPKKTATHRTCRYPSIGSLCRNGPSFVAAGAEMFKQDLPDAEIHLPDAGHFALDEKNDEIASLILAFLTKHSV
jgi:pimeloyl-ACP methyl ester carboxylesterase